METQTETTNSLDRELKPKTLLGTLVVLIILGSGLAGGYWYCNREKPEENTPNEKPQGTESAVIQPSQEYTIEDLGSGWKLYTNKTWGYSIEFPDDWLIEEPQESYAFTTFQNLNPENFPIVKKVYRTLPDDYLILIAGVGNLEYKTDNGVEIVQRKSQELNIENYENQLFSHDIAHNNYNNLLPPDLVYVGGLEAKRIADAFENEKYYRYIIPNNDFSTLYQITTYMKEPVEIPEYQYMLDSFKIL